MSVITVLPTEFLSIFAAKTEISKINDRMSNIKLWYKFFLWKTHTEDTRVYNIQLSIYTWSESFIYKLPELILVSRLRTCLPLSISNMYVLEEV